LPFSLKAYKPDYYHYSESDRTKLGNHIQKVREERQLTQKDAAVIIGVTDSAINHWEKGKHIPQHKVIKSIIDFLGYHPFPAKMEYG